MESHELFVKHFGNKPHVDIKETESFFEELNQICLKEDYEKTVVRDDKGEIIAYSQI